MRIGILPENIYNRSVYRIINKYNKDIQKGTACNSDCAFLCYKTGELSEKNSLWQTELKLILLSGVNEAAVAGKPAYLQAEIILPSKFDEPMLRALIEAFTTALEEYNLPVKEVNVRTIDGNVRPAISLLFCGKEDSLFPTKQRSKSDSKSILMIGNAGHLGASYIANRFDANLSERYGTDYIRRMKDIPKPFMYETIRTVAKENKAMLFSIGEGGIYSALWKLGTAMGSGLSVDIKAIPVIQESIEVCTFFDINPYILSSNGLLVVSDNPTSTIEELRRNGCDVYEIGQLTSSNDRIIINNDEERFLTMPEEDSIYSIMK